MKEEDRDFVQKARAAAQSDQTFQDIECLVDPFLTPNGNNLVYILPQTSRIGHFVFELHMLETLFKPTFDRIIVITEPMTKSGTNPWVRNLFGDYYRFVETDDQSIHFVGILRREGVVNMEQFKLLLWTPQQAHVELFRRLSAGTAPAVLKPSEEMVSRALIDLKTHSFDINQPFVLLHIRTEKYLEGASQHLHRLSSPEIYGPVVESLIKKNFQVVRIGEPDIEIGYKGKGYFDRSCWKQSGGYLDLVLASRCAFAVMQDSGIGWVPNSMGRKVIRLNCPHVYVNYNYMDDPTLFKIYRHKGSPDSLSFPQIISGELPLLINKQQIEAAAVDLLEHDSETLIAAVDEMWDYLNGRVVPNHTHRLRKRALGRILQNRMERMPEWGGRGLGFYGMAHEKGWVSSAMLLGQPNFWG